MNRARRAIAAGVIVTAIGVAVAAVPDPPKLVANPPVRVIHTTGPGMTSSSITIANQTADPVTITSISRDPSCDPQVTHQLVVPAIVAGNGSVPVTIQCAGTITTGLARCLFHANPTLGPALADFEVVCEGGQLPTLTASPSDLDFGDVTIGSGASTTLSIANSGATQVTNLSLHTTDLDGTFELAAPCNPDARTCTAAIATIGSGETTPVTVWCRPKTPGLHMAELHVASNTSQYVQPAITLACTGIDASTPVLALTGDPVAGGSVEVTSGSSSPAPVKLRNAGNGTLQILNVQIFDGGNGAAADWSYTASGECSGSVPPPCKLDPGEVLSLHVDFDPSAIGARDATLVIDYFDTANRSRSIPLDGEGLGATLDLVGGPLALDFGTVPLNITSNLPFQLGNQGNRSITAMLSSAPLGPPFTITPAGSINVIPGMSATVTASCRPTVVGEVTTTIHAMGSDAFTGGALDVPARCEGTNSTLYTDPSSLILGELRLNASKVMVPFDVLVASGAQLQISSVTLATPSEMLSVVGGPVMTPTTLQLVIDPQAEGDLTNEIVIVATSGATVRVPISGSIADASYQEPLARSLGTFCVNQPTTADSLAFRSTGTATIALAAPAMALGPLSPFDLEPQAPMIYPILLQPSGVASLEVTPRRQGSAGVQQDDVVWTTNVEGAETARTTISARFVDDGGAIAPDALSFGPGTIHLEQDNAQRVTLQNCDTQTIVFADPTVPAPFRIDSANFPRSLAPNETATFTIGFHPTRVGIFEETMVIQSDQLTEPLTVRLLGEGAKPIAPPDAGVDQPGIDSQSFYGCSGCSTRRPSRHLAGGLIIVIAFGMAMRRRRRR